MRVFDAFQIPYSALNREHEEWITNAHVAGAGTIIRGGVSKGISTEIADQSNLSKKVFSIITIPSNSLLSNNHHRMPMILSSDESKDYLDKSNLNYLQYNKNSNIESYIEFYEISRFVNNPLNNSIKEFLLTISLIF